MGHPYNQTQKIEIQNLKAQRFVGTDIQKNLFYGRDIPVVRYEYTFENKPVVHDYTTQKYDLLKSGDFVQLYVDLPRNRAEPFYILQGTPHDVPSLAAKYSGLYYEISFDRPSIAPAWSGSQEPSVREVAWDNFKYVQSYVEYIDWDEPKVAIAPMGRMLGTIVATTYSNVGYVFETGQYYRGDHIPSEFSAPESEEEGYDMGFFFYTGRYDGPSS